MVSENLVMIRFSGNISNYVSAISCYLQTVKESVLKHAKVVKIELFLPMKKACC